ncbi:GNAT family N-acetyltransferase [Tessaracoccus antarcticus]|uniref:N-acetyltransferase domain-containing protein n=1 Tax=Tessaracoccus antarcticus TaxID=2479848 RepID=A0A3M0GX28_9ACTN|nr:GNAT family N-acetyltransferase [Tessaracoccus antarcticus]RMB61926.1 hypothetical protein EAX62_04850 [Tessaracoccus antarcticus]
MDWDADTIVRTLERSDLLRAPFRDVGAPSSVGLVARTSYRARVDDPRVMWVSHIAPDRDPHALWSELVEVAHSRGCSTISCQATDRLTPGSHERVMRDLGFTLEADGHVLGAPVESLEPRTPQRQVELTATARSLAAASRVRATLWGTPPMSTDEATAITEAMTKLPLRERTKHDMVVWLNHQPAAVGHLDVHGHVGTLEDAATLPEYQQMGAYTATVDARLMLARAVGCHTVVAFTENDMARRVLQSRGLQVVDTTRLYTLNL